MISDEGNYAFVTLATDDNYSRGAIVLAYSLKSVGTKHKLVALITSGVSSIFRDKFYKAFDLVMEVNILDSKDEKNLLLIKRPELGVTFTKLHCWKLTQFAKCVFLDADTLVLQNCDELFLRDEFSAAPDVGWPDCFNSGVFVFKPSDDTYDSLLKFAVEHGSFDGGDQGLLNMFFSDWATKDISKHLSFIYNMNTSTTYTYIPAYKQFGKNVKIVHFLGNQKPWMCSYNKSGRIEPSDECNHSYEHLKLWWDFYMQNVVPEEYIDKGITKSMSDVAISVPVHDDHATSPQNERRLSDDHSRMCAWEQGQIDYMGRDSFENIKKKLDEIIQTASQ